jgi:hypothetical protein
MKRIINLIIVVSILVSCNQEKEESPIISKTVWKEIVMPKYIPANQKLHDTIIALDKFLWEAYNTQNDSIFPAYVTQDFEFYHDQGGVLFSKEKFTNQVKKFFEQTKGQVVYGETVKGTNEVYEIPNYGAVQLSYQRFRENNNPEWTEPATIWKKTTEGWLPARSISLHERIPEEE